MVKQRIELHLKDELKHVASRLGSPSRRDGDESGSSLGGSKSAESGPPPSKPGHRRPLPRKASSSALRRRSTPGIVDLARLLVLEAVRHAPRSTEAKWVGRRLGLSAPCTNSPGSIGQRRRWSSPHAIRSGSTRYGERSTTRRVGVWLGGLSTHGGGRAPHRPHPQLLPITDIGDLFLDSSRTRS
jgi:hypothetical protein